MPGKWPRMITTTFVCLSLCLQIAAICSPWWLVDVRGNYEERDSLFYKKTCVTLPEETCEIQSLRSIYLKARDSHISKIVVAELDYAYNQQVLKQTFVIISFCVTLVLLVAQIFRHCHANRRYHRLITRSAVFGTIPTGLMISVICIEFVRMDYLIDLHSNDRDEDHTFIDFPYSVALYIGSVVFLGVAILVLMAQSAGPGKASPKAKKPIYDEDNMDAGPPVKAEFIPIHEEYSPTEEQNTTKEQPISTICYSEKL